MTDRSVVLDAAVRQHLATSILGALTRASPRRRATLRGSLASGTADAWSDIDILWVVPDDDFTTAVEHVVEALARVRPLLSLRSDPDVQRSPKRRLFFVRLADTPLFWRVDIALFAESVGENWSYDLDNPEARGHDWSWPESALANLVAVIRAIHRGRVSVANELLHRAAKRLGVAAEGTNLAARVRVLAGAAVDHEARLAEFAAEVISLTNELPS